MSMTRTRGITKIRFVALLAIVTAVAMALPYVGGTAKSSAATSKASAVQGGVITSSLIGGAASASSPNWLLPVITLSTFTGPNIEVQQMVWRPLVALTSNLQIDYSKSIVQSVTGMDKNTVIDIKMNPKWKWSDGRPVTAQDVEFDWNLIKASCPTVSNCQYGAATPIFPAGVKSFDVISPSEFHIVLTGPFNIGTWVSNHLILFSPLPAQVMTKNPTNGKVICPDTYCNNAKDAAAEFSFLSSVADKPTNKVWSVGDGPWLLGPWVTNQSYTFYRNSHYTGGPLAHATKFIWEYFTSDQAELNALEAGQLDLGYVPLSQSNLAKLSGYQLHRYYPLLAEFINLNQGSLTNPTVSKKCTRSICEMFNMLQVRQALQMTIDQLGWSKTILHGNALPHCSTLAPIPTVFYGPYSKYCPYPFNLAKAKSTLIKAGFKLVGSAMTYEGPTGGSLPKDGASLTFVLGYPTGDTVANQEALLWQASLHKIGVTMSLKQLTFNSVLAQTNQSSANINTWDASNLTGLWYLYPNLVPTGDIDYVCGGGGNFGGYCNQKMNSLVNDQLHKQGLQSTYDYAKYAADQLPGMLNIPTPANLIEVKSTIGGFSNAQVNPAFSPVGFPELLWTH
jgi:peptide/nickel transport system substrate-binding protein